MIIAGARVGAGRYLVQERIGSGGMGAVYGARDTRLDVPVAIKLLLPEFADISELRARLKREGLIQAQLAHSHICKVFDLIDEDEHLGLVMERLTGRTLAQVIRIEGPADPATLRRWMVPIFDAIHTAHMDYVVHRDLKSNNVMLVREGRRELPKVLDFGIAKVMDESRTLITRRTGKILGTPAFMAPEQLAGAAVDERADIYALGAMLYHLSTGQLPYGAVGALRQGGVAARLPPPSSISPRLSPMFDECVAIAMALDPTDRFSSVLALTDAFEQVTKGAVLTDHRGGAEPKSGGPSVSVSLPTTDVAHLVTTEISLPPRPPEAPTAEMDTHPVRVNEAREAAPPDSMTPAEPMPADDAIGEPSSGSEHPPGRATRAQRPRRIAALVLLLIVLAISGWWGGRVECRDDDACRGDDICHAGHCQERMGSALMFYRGVIDAYNRRDRAGYFDAWEETLGCFWRADRTWTLAEIREKRSIQFDLGGQRIDIERLDAEPLGEDRVLLSEVSTHHRVGADEPVERQVVLRRSRQSWWIIGEAAPGAACLTR